MPRTVSRRPEPPPGPGPGPGGHPRPRPEGRRRARGPARPPPLRARQQRERRPAPFPSVKAAGLRSRMIAAGASPNRLAELPPPPLPGADPSGERAAEEAEPLRPARRENPSSLNRHAFNFVLILFRSNDKSSSFFHPA